MKALTFLETGHLLSMMLNNERDACLNRFRFKSLFRIEINKNTKIDTACAKQDLLLESLPLIDTISLNSAFNISLKSFKNFATNNGFYYKINKLYLYDDACFYYFDILCFLKNLKYLVLNFNKYNMGFFNDLFSVVSRTNIKHLKLEIFSIKMLQDLNRALEFAKSMNMTNLRNIKITLDIIYYLDDNTTKYINEYRQNCYSLGIIGLI